MAPWRLFFHRSATGRGSAHWLDRSLAQVLVLVARRLRAESVALILVVREPRPEFAGLLKLPLGGLADSVALWPAAGHDPPTD
jgi:hypothetical protein